MQMDMYILSIMIVCVCVCVCVYALACIHQLLSLGGTLETLKRSLLEKGCANSSDTEALQEVIEDNQALQPQPTHLLLLLLQVLIYVLHAAMYVSSCMCRIHMLLTQQQQQHQEQWPQTQQFAQHSEAALQVELVRVRAQVLELQLVCYHMLPYADVC